MGPRHPRVAGIRVKNAVKACVKPGKSASSELNIRLLGSMGRDRLQQNFFKGCLLDAGFFIIPLLSKMNWTAI